MRRRSITKIQTPGIITKKTRVAAYCRVSTENESQTVSLVSQKQHYLSLISNHSSWTFAGLYYEEGITGTKKEIRPELMRLLDDCRCGRIDLVLTKSISRFSRNTADCIEMVRTLSSLGVYVFFEKENIHTGKMESELFLSVLSSLAEDESKSISMNEKWAAQKRFQNGTFILSRAPYGYDIHNGIISINIPEAQYLRYIYESVLNGKGTCLIAEELNSRNIPTKRGGQWQPGTVQHMLDNIFFKGDLLMQKYWKDDLFKVKTNHGEYNQYLIENHHPALVSEDMYDSAQYVNKMRGHPLIDHNQHYPLSYKIVCGECGCTYKRVTVHRKSDTAYFWACSNHLKHKENCSMKRISEATLQNLFTTMMNKLIFGKDVVLVRYLNRLKASQKTQEDSSIDLKLRENNEARKKLTHDYSMRFIDSVTYHIKTNELLREAALLKSERNNFKDTKQQEETRELLQYLTEASSFTEFNEDAFIRFVDHITAVSDTVVTFHLSCGLTLTEEAERNC
ncbi:MAG: recombinase family protein [Solobacterium sp.]|nr:recombinase family protein [Solobacterium sp.]